jgi:hypothetical protein
MEIAFGDAALGVRSLAFTETRSLFFCGEGLTRLLASANKEIYAFVVGGVDNFYNPLQFIFGSKK